jgi:hypothetical protein
MMKSLIGETKMARLCKSAQTRTTMVIQSDVYHRRGYLI